MKIISFTDTLESDEMVFRFFMDIFVPDKVFIHSQILISTKSGNLYGNARVTMLRAL